MHTELPHFPALCPWATDVDRALPTFCRFFLPFQILARSLVWLNTGADQSRQPSYVENCQQRCRGERDPYLHTHTPSRAAPQTLLYPLLPSCGPEHLLQGCGETGWEASHLDLLHASPIWYRETCPALRTPQAPPQHIGG